MSRKPLAAILRSFGPAAQSVEVCEWSPEPPAAGEVSLEVLAAPVNPADINIIEGKYGDLPTLPAVIGNEGVGRVVGVGAGVDAFQQGDLAVILRRGTWAQSVTVAESELVKIPATTDILQAAMLGVNPPTAFLMLRDFVSLSPGDWVVQNAANSAVGRAVLQIARGRGLKTLNVVRREELVPELIALGADVVVTEATDLRKEVRGLCGGVLPRLGLNAVGGPSALNVANALASGSTLVTYGAMGMQPLKIPNGLLIFKDLRFAGFWLTNWKSRSTPAERGAVLAELAAMSASGALRLAVHATYPLTSLAEALAAATGGSRSGKVLLDLR